MKQTLIEYVDDLDGSPGAETVRFGLDGSAYEIDLNGRHAREFREVVREFTACARPARRKPASRTPAARENATKVRMWARNHGYTVAKQGRIPVGIQEAFSAALRNTRTPA